MNYKEALTYMQENGSKIGEDIITSEDRIVSNYHIDLELILPSPNVWSKVNVEIKKGFDNETALINLGLINESLDVYLIADIFKDPITISLRDYLKNLIR